MVINYELNYNYYCCLLFLIIILLFYNCTKWSFDEKYTNLFLACEKGDINAVKEFINQGYNINYRKYLIGGKVSVYITPLSVSTENENFDLCKYLIENGAVPDVAAYIANRRLLDLIYTLRVINNKTTYKEINTNPNPYEIEIFNRYKNNDLVGITYNEFNPNIIDESGKHLIHYAINNKLYRNLNVLFSYGVNPNYIYNHDFTFYQIINNKYNEYVDLLELYKRYMDEDSINKL